MNRYFSDRNRKLVYAFISGALGVLAFSPFDIYPLAFVSLSLIICIWLQCRPWFAFITGYVYGLGFFGLGVNWLYISINLFGGINIIGAVFLTFTLIAFLSLYPALAGYLSSRLHARTGSCMATILGIPAIWTLVEWLRSWLFTGFPWLSMGYSQTDSVLSGFAPVGGIFAVSLLVGFISAACVFIARAGRARQLITLSSVILVIALSWYFGTVQWTNRSDRVLTVALIQGAVPQQVKWDPEMLLPTMSLYRELTRPHLSRDLIIWPEASIPAYYHQASGFIDEIRQDLRNSGSRLLTGIPVYDGTEDRYYNSTVLLGETTSFYYKKHLVPFGEYLPLKFLLEGPVEYFKIPVSDFSAGPDEPPVHDAGGYKIGISICYEDVFGNEVIQALPDASLLINVSNDAWFGDSLAPHQHLQMARMRALEGGRYLLRATNTGISAIINDKGRVLSAIPQFIPASLTANVFLYNGHTPYSSMGNYPVVLFSLVILLAVVFPTAYRNTPS